MITTLFNEADSLDPLFRSILDQSRKPDELVVVDGGSTDGTWERVQEWAPRFRRAGIKFRAIQDRGNIAHGRNVAIQHASHPLIASIDGGCVADRKWLESLLAAYKPGTVVTGNFKPLARNFQERVQAVFVRPSAGDNPSSRSVLFEKEAWKEVGGYPEHLYTGEDTLFNARLKKVRRFVFAPEAVVHWRMRPSLWRWLRQYYLYGYGDGLALNLDTHTTYGKKLSLLLLSAYAFLPFAWLFPSLLPALFIPSLLYGLYRSFSVEGAVAGLLLPFRYAFFVAGFHRGLLGRIWKR